MPGAVFAGRLAALPARQRQVLDLWASGRTYVAIAAQLGISRKTVETHLALARARLAVPPGAPAGRALCYALGAAQGACEEVRSSQTSDSR